MKGSYQDPAQIHSEEILLEFAEAGWVFYL